jgi:hypothetical protein
MNDTLAPPTISPEAVAAIGQLSPEAATQAKVAFEKSGYAPAEVAAVFAGQLPTQAAAKTANDAKTAEQIKSLREQWAGDPNVLETYISRLEGNATLPGSLSPPPDGDYRLDFGEHGRALDAQELGATNSEIASAFKQMEIPENLAQSLLDTMLDSLDRFTDLGDQAQVEQYNRDQARMLANLPGGKAELMRLAALAAARMPSETYNSLREAGCFESAQSIAALAAAGRAIEYRTRGSK